MLYWVDILGQNLHIYDPVNKINNTISIGQYVSTVVPRSAGGVALTTQNGFFALDFDSEELQPIADPERNIPDNRFNDGKCDAVGRFWAGTMAMKVLHQRGAILLGSRWQCKEGSRRHQYFQWDRLEPRQ